MHGKDPYMRRELLSGALAVYRSLRRFRTAVQPRRVAGLH